jgi:cyclopropane fatty-acyl-phospholipid synthase-like methyltransferase
MSAVQMRLTDGSTPAEHPSFPRLTADQKRAVNEVWDDTVLPTLEAANQFRRDADDQVLHEQQIADGLRLQVRDLRDALERALDEAARLRWAATL